MPTKHNKKKTQTSSSSSGVHVNNTNAHSSPQKSVEVEHRKPDFVLPPGNVIVEQNLEMKRQDEQLVDLEASIDNLRDASLTINQEVTLQNRLLDDVHVNVDRVQQRQQGTQERLRSFMRTSSTCKLWMMIIFLGLVLVLLLVLLK